VSRNSLGKESYSLGPSTENAQRPPDDQRRSIGDVVRVISETRTQSGARYTLGCHCLQRCWQYESNTV